MYPQLTVPNFWDVIAASDSSICAHFRWPVRRREITSAIAESYPRLGFGKMADWVGGRLTMLAPDRPAVAGISHLLKVSEFRTLIPAKDASIFCHPDSGLKTDPAIVDP